jgi:hypothetical protein
VQELIHDLNIAGPGLPAWAAVNLNRRLSSTRDEEARRDVPHRLSMAIAATLHGMPHLLGVPRHPGRHGHVGRCGPVHLLVTATFISRAIESAWGSPGVLAEQTAATAALVPGW